MFKHIQSFLNDLVTTRDGVSFDPIRVGGIVTGVVFLSLATFHVVVLRQPFDALNFGSGAAALFAGMGAGIGLKRNDEPDASN